MGVRYITLWPRDYMRIRSSACFVWSYKTATKRSNRSLFSGDLAAKSSLSLVVGQVFTHSVKDPWITKYHDDLGRRSKDLSSTSFQVLCETLPMPSVHNALCHLTGLDPMGQVSAGSLTLKYWSEVATGNLDHALQTP